MQGSNTRDGREQERLAVKKSCLASFESTQKHEDAKRAVHFHETEQAERTPRLLPPAALRDVHRLQSARPLLEVLLLPLNQRPSTARRRARSPEAAVAARPSPRRVAVSAASTLHRRTRRRMYFALRKKEERLAEGLGSLPLARVVPRRPSRAAGHRRRRPLPRRAGRRIQVRPPPSHALGLNLNEKRLPCKSFRRIRYTFKVKWTVLDPLESEWKEVESPSTKSPSTPEITSKKDKKERTPKPSDAVFCNKCHSSTEGLKVGGGEGRSPQQFYVCNHIICVHCVVDVNRSPERDGEGEERRRRKQPSPSARIRSAAPSASGSPTARCSRRAPSPPSPPSPLRRNAVEIKRFSLFVRLT